MPIIPTLSAMAEIYELSRDGGPKSPRFTAYVGRAEHTLGLSGYNPMAGQAALDAVRALIDMDAESIAAEMVEEVRARCEFREDVTLAIVVASAGMWTDRLATEVQHRTDAKRAAREGRILLWSREPVTENDVRREAAAETVRVIWSELHGAADSMGRVLSREGFAYANAINTASTEHTSPDEKVGEALAILGDTSTLGDVVALLYGDDAAVQLGYVPLGLAERAGFDWAAHRAEVLIGGAGAVHAIREFADFLAGG